MKPARSRLPTPRELRRLFFLDPSWTYLNHGSFGACPRKVLSVAQAWQRELETAEGLQI